MDRHDRAARRPEPEPVRRRRHLPAGTGRRSADRARHQSGPGNSRVRQHRPRRYRGVSGSHVPIAQEGRSHGQGQRQAQRRPERTASDSVHYRRAVSYGTLFPSPRLSFSATSPAAGVLITPHCKMHTRARCFARIIERCVPSCPFLTATVKYYCWHGLCTASTKHDLQFTGKSLDAPIAALSH